MKLKYIISVAAILTCAISFGSSDSFAQKQKKDKNAPVENPIVPQVNPLVIELETFEGRPLGGERNFIGIAGHLVQGKITYVNGMVRVGRLTGRDALIFNKCEARIGDPHVNKKGTNYSFDVRVRDALFFNSNPNTDWLLEITVYDDGKVFMNISSDSITRVYQNHWTFMGHVDAVKTQKLKELMEMDPNLFPKEEDF